MTTASVRGCICYFGICLTSILLASSASAQITDVTPVQSPPIPGAGHGYIQMLDETVNPSNGTVSIRINVPVPGGRHLTVPFGFGYDSNTAIFINGQGYAGNNSYLAAGGWSYVVPHLDFQHKDITYYEQYVGGAPVKSTVYSCDLYNDHIFTDPQGGTHALYLALFANVSGCTAYLAGFTPTDVLTGSDGKVTATTTAALSPITVSDTSGTVYYFSGTGHPLATSSGYSALPEWVENSNGDRVTITDSGSGVFNMVDTLGRNVLASSGFGQTGNTVTVSGLSAPYKVTWGTAGGTWIPGWSVSTDCTGTGCGSCSPVQIGSPAGIPVISAITLPNQTSYQFSYDPTYGVISKIIYPTGGYVRYVWTVNHLSDAIDFYLDNNSQNPQDTNFNCHERFDTLAVQHRYVSADGNPAHEYQQQTFSYGTTQWTVPDSGTPGYEVWNAGGKSTAIVTNDTLRGTSESVSRSYAPVSLTPNPYDGSWRFVFNGNCESTCNTDGIVWSQPVYREYPVEQVTTFEDGSGNSLKTVTQSFADQYRLNCAVTAATDVTPAAISGAFYTWGAGDRLTEKKEYGFGVISNPATCETNSVPSAVPTRETAITYASFSTNPIGSTILDRPSIVQVYGGGALAAETDYSYDLYGSSGISLVTATGHDDTNFPASYTNRGNATTATRKCFVGANACTNATTTYGYDQTGQITAATDPCGNSTCPDMTGSTHTAHYYYTDSYTVLSGSSNVSYTPSGNTDGFLTKVTNALGQTSTFTYDYNSSELTASKDQNDINAARPGTTYIYNDPFARPKQVNYPDGGQTTIAYSDTGPSPSVTTTKLISSGVNLGTTTVMDGMGHVVQTQLTTDPDSGGTVDYVDTAYDGMGRVLTVSNPHRSSALPTDGTTTNTYDALGRTTLIQRPDGSSVQTLYDQTCIVNTMAVGTIVIDEAGNIRESCSDGLGRLVEVDEPGNNGQTAEPGKGSVTFLGNEQGPVATCPQQYGYCYVWDSGTFDVTVDGVLMTVSYSEGSTSSSIASALVTAINEDSSSPVTAAPNGSAVNLTANITGSDSDYPLSVSLAGHDTQWFSSPSFSISASGSTLTGGSGGLGTGSLVTQYTYDILGNMTCAVQKGTDTTAFSTCASASANWRPRSFAYDSLSRLTSSFNPESGTITYAYDPNSNLITRVTPKANQTGTSQITHNYTYDVLNRLLAETHAAGSDANDEYAYDGNALTSGCGQNPPTITSTNAIGRRSAMCGTQSGSSWSFDPMGRPILESTRNHGSATATLTVNYTYNKDGSLNTLTYPSGDVVTYKVGGAGRTTQVTDSNNNFVMSATYAPPGLLTGMTSGSGIATVNSYNDRLQPFMLSAGTVFSQCYDFHLHVAISNATCNFPAYTTGNNGNVFQIKNNLDPTRTTAFAYDSLNRVSQANTVNTSSSNCWGETYTIDSWGNLTNRSAPSGMAGNCVTEGLSATAATSNQLNGVGMTYDAAGNVTKDNLANTYTYDSENRIATAGGYTYSYDADGARMEKTTGSTGTMYWQGPSGALAETNLAGTINEEYIFFNGARIARVDRPSGTPHYYFSNNVGSHTVVTNAAGVCEQDIDYFPYGGVIKDYCPVVAQHYKFTGKERDGESGLDNFGARYDASSLGRFMTPDWSAKPQGVPYAVLGDPQSLNLYAYVRNNPTSFYDHDGHCWGWAQRVCNAGQIVYNGFRGKGFYTNKRLDEYYRALGYLHENNISTKHLGLAGVVRTYQTYQMNHPTKPTYSGRTSGFGTPEENVARRTSEGNHHMREKGYEAGELDKSSENPDAIRGRAQQLVESNGGAQSEGGTSGNAINEVGPRNSNGPGYMKAATEEFGEAGGAAEAAEGVEGAGEAVEIIEILNIIPE